MAQSGVQVEDEIKMHNAFLCSFELEPINVGFGGCKLKADRRVLMSRSDSFLFLFSFWKSVGVANFSLKNEKNLNFRLHRPLV